MDLNRATRLTEEYSAEIDNVFEYHPWDADKQAKGDIVRRVLATAVKVIVEKVPPCPDRSTAIRKIREASMDCSSAITHDGRY